MAQGLPRISPGEFVDGTYVPKGVYVATDPLGLNLDPENAPEPRAFKPERWLPNSGLKKPFTAPFSVGPRSCIGVNLAWLEMRLAVAKIVYACDWEFVADPGDWIADCRLTQLWLRAPYEFRVTPRSHGNSEVKA